MNTDQLLPHSELSRLNEDPRETVPVSALMARLAQAVTIAGSLTGGLVDATLLESIETAGYTSDLPHPLPLDKALELAPARRPARASAHPRWQQIHVDSAARTALATSGIGRRSWLSERGAPAHHLLDPSTGAPAYTGVVQASALAPSALLAEVHAKAALLGGPVRARAALPHGDVIVLDDGSHQVIEPPPTVTLGELAAYAA